MIDQKKDSYMSGLFAGLIIFGIVIIFVAWLRTPTPSDSSADQKAPVATATYRDTSVPISACNLEKGKVVIYNGYTTGSNASTTESQNRSAEHCEEVYKQAKKYLKDYCDTHPSSAMSWDQFVECEDAKK